MQPTETMIEPLAFRPEDVEILDKDVVFQGHFRVDLYTLRHRCYDGGWSAPVRREIFERGHAVGVVLYDPALDRLVLIEQFRPGALAALSDSPNFSGREPPWLIEVVAGIIEPGESAEAVARREAQEEAGCTVDELIPAHRLFVSPGASSESVQLFCGRTDASAAGGIHGVDDEHEDIRVLALPPEEVFGLLDEGRISNGVALVALYWFRQHHAAIRRRWLSPAGESATPD